ncbi:hypothetical protein [Streptomyces vastus]|uniref:Uncharacterized protein n=1 Tax=Streptomyces vastus TaxID=285451 RepID=A0ABN3RIE0_9ACTN
MTRTKKAIAVSVMAAGMLAGTVGAASAQTVVPLERNQTIVPLDRNNTIVPASKSR